MFIDYRVPGDASPLPASTDSDERERERGRKGADWHVQDERRFSFRSLPPHPLACYSSLSSLLPSTPLASRRQEPKTSVQWLAEPREPGRALPKPHTGRRSLHNPLYCVPFESTRRTLLPFLSRRPSRTLPALPKSSQHWQGKPGSLCSPTDAAAQHLQPPGGHRGGKCQGCKPSVRVRELQTILAWISEVPILASKWDFDERICRLHARENSHGDIDGGDFQRADSAFTTG